MVASANEKYFFPSEDKIITCLEGDPATRYPYDPETKISRTMKYFFRPTPVEEDIREETARKIAQVDTINKAIAQNFANSARDEEIIDRMVKKTVNDVDRTKELDLSISEGLQIKGRIMEAIRNCSKKHSSINEDDPSFR